MGLHLLRLLWYRAWYEWVSGGVVYSGGGGANWVYVVLNNDNIHEHNA